MSNDALKRLAEVCEPEATIERLEDEAARLQACLDDAEADKRRLEARIEELETWVRDTVAELKDRARYAP
jgi:phage shock protein A